MTKLLAANRSEIAVRIFRSATELGCRTVAVYAKEDRFGVHRFKADESYLIGQGKGPVADYLDIDSIIDLAKSKGVDLIHPGYGFLSENASFAKACEENGITFVGPYSAYGMEVGIIDDYEYSIDDSGRHLGTGKINRDTIPCFEYDHDGDGYGDMVFSDV